jgi:hypothetical protein
MDKQDFLKHLQRQGVILTPQPDTKPVIMLDHPNRNTEDPIFVTLPIGGHIPESLVARICSRLGVNAPW